MRSWSSPIRLKGTPRVGGLDALRQSTPQSLDLGSSGGLVQVEIQGPQTNLRKPIETN
jgi:hypothetical protein